MCASQRDPVVTNKPTGKLWSNYFHTTLTFSRVHLRKLSCSKVERKPKRACLRDFCLREEERRVYSIERTCRVKRILALIDLYYNTICKCVKLKKSARQPAIQYAAFIH